MRKNFYDIVNKAEFNPQIEFDRIKLLFISKNNYINFSKHYNMSLREIINNYFNFFPYSLKGRTINIVDFENSHKISIYYNEKFTISTEELITYCEFVKTLIYTLLNISTNMYSVHLSPEDIYFARHLLSIIDDTMNAIDFIPITKGDFQLFIPKDAAVVSASEIVPEEIVNPILEYHHRNLEGDIDKKKTILLKLADQLEPRRKDLKSINSTLEDNLFYLFNNMNIRHNNTNSNDKSKYKAYVDNLQQKELEDWYDETYQLCLLAFLELDNLERNNKIKQLKQDVSNTK